jgi:hypothetical protein
MLSGVRRFSGGREKFIWGVTLFQRKHFFELPVIFLSLHCSDGMDMTPLMCSVFPAGASNARQSKA